jgi:hypothetical protein
MLETQPKSFVFVLMPFDKSFDDLIPSHAAGSPPRRSRTYGVPKICSTPSLTLTQ